MSAFQPENLASEAFWEDDYLAGVTLPVRPDPGFAFERTLARELAARAPVARGERVLEIGCAPAKWLLFYAERFGAQVAGIEYTPHGAELSRRNLERAGVEGKIVEGDFFTVLAEPVHDIVLSLGFIEHFDDLDAAFARHLAFLAPGGRLVIGVPNYLGLIGRVQRVADPAHLALHNLAAMEPARYRELAARHGLEIVSQEYLNGPDPALLKLRGRALVPVAAALSLLRRSPLGERVDGRLMSTYGLTVLRRPA